MTTANKAANPNPRPASILPFAAPVGAGEEGESGVVVIGVPVEVGLVVLVPEPETGAEVEVEVVPGATEEDAAEEDAAEDEAAEEEPAGAELPAGTDTSPFRHSELFEGRRGEQVMDTIVSVCSSLEIK